MIYNFPWYKIILTFINVTVNLKPPVKSALISWIRYHVICISKKRQKIFVEYSDILVSYHQLI